MRALNSLRFDLSLKETLNLIDTVPELYLDFIFQKPWPKEYEDIGKFKVYYKAPNVLKELRWSFITFLKFKTKIEDFLKFQDKYEALFLIGKYNESINILDKIEAKFGVSLWGLEHRFLSLEYAYGLEENKSFLSEINNITQLLPVMVILAQHLSNKAESKMSVLKYHNYVAQLLSKYEEYKELQDYFRYKLEIFDFETVGNFEFIIFIDNLYSVIDRYLTFKRVLQIICARSLFIEYSSELSQIIETLRKEIRDPDLDRVATYLNPGGKIEKDKLTEEYLEISDKYTVGSYSEAIVDCKKTIINHPNSIEFCLLYLKATIYANKILEPLFQVETIIDKALKGMYLVLRRDKNSDEAFILLSKLSLSLSGFQWAFKLYLFLHKESDPDYKPEFRSLAMILSKIHNVKQARAYNRANDGLVYLNNISASYGDKLTISLWKHIELQLVKREFKEISIDADEIRKKVYNSKLYQYLGEYKKAIFEYKKLLQTDKIVSPSRHPHLFGNIVFDLFNCFLSDDGLVEAIELSVKTFIQNPFFTRKFDLTSLITRIESANTKHIHENICTAILFAIATQPINKIYVAYDSYLTSSNVKRPSQLLEIDILVSNDLKLYFLHKVCSIDVMYKSIYFDGTEDIENERLVILKYLALNDRAFEKRYTDEINIITKKQAIRKGIQQVGESKIFVDIDGIKNVSEKLIAESFSRYLEFSTFDIEDFKLLDNKSTRTLIAWTKAAEDKQKSNMDDIVFSSNIKFLLFQEMFYEIRDRFISSNEYGLDSYLSVRIRHGTLSGQLRKPFEQEYLITQKDKISNQYFENEHWDYRLLGMGAAKSGLLQNILSSFSRKIDEIIRGFKEDLIQVKTENNNPSGLFDFSYSTQELLQMYKNWYAEIRQFDAFVNRVFGDLLERTEFILKSIRLFISTDLSRQIISELDILWNELSELCEGFRLSGLSSAIASCKTSVQNELYKISEWFQFSRNKGIDEFTIELSTETSKNMINNICQNEFKPSIKIQCRGS